MHQLNLDANSSISNKNRMTSLLQRDGQLFYDEQFLSPTKSARYYECLLNELEWHEENLTLFGRRIKAPRLVCWYGDHNAFYTYSGIKHSPLPWSNTLKELKNQVEKISSYTFNSALANLYRNGQDSVGWHADKERELGLNPAIASVSLGEQRTFKIRHNRTKEIFNIELVNGSLLVMKESFQHAWQHCLPKTKQAKNSRINITFRKIINY